MNAITRKVPFISILLAICCISCQEPAEVKNEKYEISTDSLYVACADLSGLGNLKIDETTWNQVLKDSYVTMPKYSLESNFYSGFWGVENFEIERYIKNDVKRIKQLRIGNGVYPYKVGEIHFDEIDLAFLDGILVAISIGSDYYKVDEHYIKKYGEGQGYYNWYCKQKGENGGKNFSLEKHEHTQRIWANEKVKLERKYDWDSQIVNNKTIYSNKGDDYCIFTSQSRYEEFVKILTAAKTDYYSIKEQKMKDSYKNL